MAVLEPGWDAPTEVRRTVRLPDELDAVLADYAAEQQTSPAIVIAEAVAHYLQHDPIGEIAESAPEGPYVERRVALAEDLSRALDARADQLTIDASAIVGKAVAKELNARETPIRATAT